MQTKALAGKRIIVLRPVDQAEELLTKIDELGGTAIHCPMLATKPTANLNLISAIWLEQFTMLIFASSNAVNYFLQGLAAKQINPQTAVRDKKIIAVGTATAACLQQNNLHVDLVPQLFSQEGISAALAADLSMETILLANATDSRKHLQDTLEQRQARVTALPIYTSYCPEFSAIELQANDYVIFTSGMLAEFFFQSGMYKNQEIIAVCIGDITQQKVAKYFYGRTIVAAQASVDGIIKAICHNNHDQ